MYTNTRSVIFIFISIASYLYTCAYLHVCSTYYTMIFLCEVNINLLFDIHVTFHFVNRHNLVNVICIYRLLLFACIVNLRCVNKLGNKLGNLE